MTAGNHLAITKTESRGISGNDNSFLSYGVTTTYDFMESMDIPKNPNGVQGVAGSNPAVPIL